MQTLSIRKGWRTEVDKPKCSDPRRGKGKWAFGNSLTFAKVVGSCESGMRSRYSYEYWLDEQVFIAQLFGWRVLFVDIFSGRPMIPLRSCIVLAFQKLLVCQIHCAKLRRGVDRLS